MTRIGTIVAREMNRLAKKRFDIDARYSLTPAGEAALDALLDTGAAVQSVRQAYDATSGDPRPEWVRGVCPTCGGPVVANSYYIGGRGYKTLHECWHSLSADPTCTYRKVL